MRISYILLPILAFILTACPGSTPQTIRKIQENNMDFPNPIPLHQFGVGFNLSELFKKDYYSDYTLNPSSSVTYATAYNEVIFTLEVFPNTQISSIQFKNDKAQQPNVDAVKDYYIEQRLYSIENGSVSEATDLYAKTKKKGWIHLVEEKGEYRQLGYLTATIDYNNQIYVAQLICDLSTIGYFYDDFLEIVTSIK